MVRIDWDSKLDISDRIKEFQKKDSDLFSKVENLSYLNDTQLRDGNNDKLFVNELFWGDNIEVLIYLLKYFEEKIDMIYIDPPFFSGSNYHIEIESNKENYEDIAYYDYWEKDLDSYVQMLYERILLFSRDEYWLCRERIKCVS